MASLENSFLLTGANGAVGRSLIRQFASNPQYTATYHGIYTVRDEKSAQALEGFLSDCNHSYDIFQLDLACQKQVRAFATDLRTRIHDGRMPPIRSLVLNAAFLELKTQTWTEDGFDMSFAASYLGHWLLTMMLLGSMDRDMGRIVVVGSSVHDTQSSHNIVGGQYRDPKWQEIFHDSADPLARGTWSTTHDGPFFRSGYRRYGAAKLCQAMMIPELQARLDKDPALSNLCILGVDPGSTPSGITRRGGWVIHVFIGQFVMLIMAHVFSWFFANAAVRTNEKAGKDLLAAMLQCNANLGKKPKGLYLDGDSMVELGAEARDRNKTGILWRDTLRYTGLRSEDTCLASL